MCARFPKVATLVKAAVKAPVCRVLASFDSYWPDFNAAIISMLASAKGSLCLGRRK
jgi:hypothetical protein